MGVRAFALYLMDTEHRHPRERSVCHKVVGFVCFSRVCGINSELGLPDRCGQTLSACKRMSTVNCEVLLPVSWITDLWWIPTWLILATQSCRTSCVKMKTKVWLDVKVVCVHTHMVWVKINPIVPQYLPSWPELVPASITFIAWLYCQDALWVMWFFLECWSSLLYAQEKMISRLLSTLQKSQLALQLRCSVHPTRPSVPPS